MAGSGRPIKVALFVGLVVAWGLNYIFVREGLPYAAPLWLAFLRSGVGALGAAAIVGLRASRSRLDRAARRDALLLGIPNTALFFGLWFVAAGSVLPGIASVVVYTFPLWVAVFSGPVLHRRVGPVDGLAIVGGFVGVVLIAQPCQAGAGQLPLVAVLELLAGAVSWATGTVVAQRRFPPSDLIEVNAYQLAGGATALFVASVLFEGGTVPVPSAPLLGIVLWLGLVGTSFGYAVWFWLLGRTHASRLSAYVFLVPVVALAASSLLFGERLDLLQVVGVAAVLAALYAIGVHARPPTPLTDRTTAPSPTRLDGRL